VTEFIEGILELAGIDDVPTYKRAQVVNEAEVTEMVLSAASYLDERTVLEKLPWISVDEIDGIMDARNAEEAARYAGGDTEPL
jgi:hypothetical protein